MQIIYNDDYLTSKYTEKISIFQKEIAEHPFILLARPRKNIYDNQINQNEFLQRVEKIIDSGLKFLELPWEDNDNWLTLMQRLRLKFPNILIGSSTIKNKSL